MPRKQARKKQTYGTIQVDHVGPPPQEGWPKAINVVLSFEEALKLQLALQHRLLDINELNRATREGKAAAVNLCLFLERGHQLTVTSGKLRR